MTYPLKKERKMSANYERPLLRKIYAIIGILLIAYSTYIVFVLVGHIWHMEGESDKEKTSQLSEEEKLFKEMITDKKIVEYNLGYKVIKQEDIEKHFHHVGELTLHDEINLCIKCHGDIPHDKNKVIRAFLNMHSDFLSCETCHVRIDNNDKKYFWYDKKSGKELSNISISKFLSNSQYKLAPYIYAYGKYERFDSEKRRNFIDDFRKVLPTLTPDKKSQGLKLIHKFVSKQTVKCDECHSPSEKECYLPLKNIGYDQQRILQILSNEVVGMVNKYKDFYIPNILKEQPRNENKKGIIN